MDEENTIQKEKRVNFKVAYTVGVELETGRPMFHISGEDPSLFELIGLHLFAEKCLTRGTVYEEISVRSVVEGIIDKLKSESKRRDTEQHFEEDLPVKK